MKALFISYNQALSDRVMETLNRQQVRGFTKWALTQGRGSVDGEPHYGNHTWPAMNASLISMVEDHKVAPLLEALRTLDRETKQQGLRAYVLPVEDQL